MDGTLATIIQGPRYDTYWFTMGDRKGKTYTGTDYRNYARWKKLKIGDTVTGLRWRDEIRGLLDADSPVKVVQARLWAH